MLTDCSVKSMSRDQEVLAETNRHLDASAPYPAVWSGWGVSNGSINSSRPFRGHVEPVQHTGLCAADREKAGLLRTRRRILRKAGAHPGARKSGGGSGARGTKWARPVRKARRARRILVVRWAAVDRRIPCNGRGNSGSAAPSAPRRSATGAAKAGTVARTVVVVVALIILVAIILEVQRQRHGAQKKCRDRRAAGPPTGIDDRVADGLCEVSVSAERAECSTMLLFGPPCPALLAHLVGASLRVNAIGCHSGKFFQTHRTFWLRVHRCHPEACDARQQKSPRT